MAQAQGFETSYGAYGEGGVQMGLPPSRIQQFHQSENRAIRAGGAILREAPDVFPSSRKCRDILWSILFVALLGALGYFAYTESKGWSFNGGDFNHDAKKVGLKAVLAAMGSSVVVACLLALLFLLLVRCCTKLIVWTSLLFTPTVMLLLSASMMVYPKFWNFADQTLRLIACGSLSAVALVMLMCYCMCWRKLIDFTVKLLHAVAGVLGQHLSLCFVALVSLVFSIVWAILCATVVVGASDRLTKAQHDCASNADNHKYLCLGEGDFYGLYGLIVLIFTWGTTIFMNVSHTTNCGVFGRWYFSRPASVRSSLWASLTTSFGSICLGSLIVAFVSAVESILRMMRRQGGRNAVATILLCVLDCLIICIRDMVEAFSYFAYVQVAIRGFSFLSSAKVTFALCKWENLFALVATSLVGNVCSLGSLMCGILSGAVGYFVGAKFVPEGLSKDEVSNIHVVNIISAIIIGAVVARTILNVLRSGFATIVVCWAENKEALRTLQYGLYDDFNQRSQALTPNLC